MVQCKFCKKKGKYYHANHLTGELEDLCEEHYLIEQNR